MNTTQKVKPTIIILKDTRKRNGFISFRVIATRLTGSAKVFNEPDGTGADYMGYGVREGSRVSKLYIRSHVGLTAQVYNWDRGFDYHDTQALPQSTLDDVIDALDRLPQI